MTQQGHDHFYKVWWDRVEQSTLCHCRLQHTAVVLNHFAQAVTYHSSTLSRQDSCWQVMRVMGQWDILDEKAGRHFAANAATRQLVRGKEATLGSFVDHQVKAVLNCMPVRPYKACLIAYMRRRLAGATSAEQRVDPARS